jgi:hypothetical protein
VLTRWPAPAPGQAAHIEQKEKRQLRHDAPHHVSLGGGQTQQGPRQALLLSPRIAEVDGVCNSWWRRLLRVLAAARLRPRRLAASRGRSAAVLRHPRWKPMAAQPSAKRRLRTPGVLRAAGRLRRTGRCARTYRLPRSTTFHPVAPQLRRACRGQGASQLSAMPGFRLG